MNKIMMKFKKILVPALMAVIFIAQDAAFCFAQRNESLRAPVAANSREGSDRLKKSFSLFLDPYGLDNRQAALLKEILPVLEEKYLSVKGTGFIREEDSKQSADTLEYFREKGSNGIEVLKFISVKDSRSWVRAKAVMALSELASKGDAGIVEFLLGAASKDKSLLVRSLIVRKILEDIKKDCVPEIKKLIEKGVKKVNLNPWSAKDGLRVLDAGCGYGEASCGIARHYRALGFDGLVVLGVDGWHVNVINAEKNKTDDAVVFIYGKIGPDKDYFPADIVISQNLLIYRDELRNHAVSLFNQVNKDGGAVYFSPSVFNASYDSSGEDGIMRLFDMENIFKDLLKDEPGVRCKITRSDMLEANVFGFKDYISGAFNSPWGASTGWIEAAMPSKITVSAQNASVKLRQSRFPDGEAYLRILNSDVIKDSDVTVNCSFNSSQDIIEVVLLMDFLKVYGAKSVKLFYRASDSVSGDGSGIIEFLKLFCDSVAYKNGEQAIELNTQPVRTLTAEEKNTNVWVDIVAYQHQRLEKDAKDAVNILEGAVSKKIDIRKNGPNPLNWKIEIGDDLKGKNIALLHSTENNVDIIELWMMLIAFKKAGVESVHVFNAYEGYSRQDKIFNKGEGVSALTMLKALDKLSDSHFALNVHYLDNTGPNRFGGIQIYNVNAFVQIAEYLFNFIVGSSGAGDIAKEFEAHPLLLLGPDDGAFEYIKEAKVSLEKYIKEKYGINVNVYCGYLDKTRVSGTEVKMKGEVLSDEGKPITGISDLKDSWVFVIDDETSSGGTLLTATYVLSEQIGVAWRRILTGVAHGKLAMGIKPFYTGLTESVITEAIKNNAEIKPNPEYVDISKKRMPPRLFVCTSSVHLPEDFPEGQKVSIGPNIAHFIKRIIGYNMVSHIGNTQAQTQL